MTWCYPATVLLILPYGKVLPYYCALSVTIWNNINLLLRYYSYYMIHCYHVTVLIVLLYNKVLA